MPWWGIVGLIVLAAAGVFMIAKAYMMSVTPPPRHRRPPDRRIRKVLTSALAARRLSGD